VRDTTGYAIGGVCPIGHVVKPVMLIDRDLFNLTVSGRRPAIRMPSSISRPRSWKMTGGTVADVRLDAAPAAS
jgi:hypothetical protein